MSHTVLHAKPMNKAGQIVLIAAIVACVLSIFTLFALSARTARPSTLEADPGGFPFHHDPDMPGRRF